MNKKQYTFLDFLIVIVIITLLVSLAIPTYNKLKKQQEVDKYSNSEICRAIYKAEGGNLSSIPYGIKSVECKGKKECKQVCLNTVKNNKKRYKEYGYKKYDTFLKFLASRYAPIRVKNDPNNLNQYWLENIKYFLK